LERNESVVVRMGESPSLRPFFKRKREKNSIVKKKKKGEGRGRSRSWVLVREVKLTGTSGQSGRSIVPPKKLQRCSGNFWKKGHQKKKREERTRTLFPTGGG